MTPVKDLYRFMQYSDRRRTKHFMSTPWLLYCKHSECQGAEVSVHYCRPNP